MAFRVGLYVSILITFVLKAHSVCIKADYQYYSTQHFWNQEGERRQTFNHFELHQIDWAVQSCFRNDDAFSFYGNYKRIREDMNGNACGFGDLELLYRRSVWNAVSLYGIGVIPVDTKFKPALRYGRYAGELGIGWCHSAEIWGYGNFWDATLGYRIYEGFPSDQIRASFLYLFCLASCFSLEWDLDLEYGVFNGKSQMNESLVLLNSNYRLLKTSVQGNFSLFECVSLQIGYFQHLWGRNVGTSGGGFAGGQILF